MVIDSSPMEEPDFGTVTIAKLVAYYNRGKGKLNLNPSVQRKSVWRLRDRSSLINTILRKYPLPAVVFCKRRDRGTGKMMVDVIDGKQRIETILLYMGEMKGDDRFFRAALSHYEDGDETIRKVCWKELSEKNRRAIRRYRIPVVTIEAGPAQIRDIFVRINSTGKALTGQEIRNANYVDGPFLKKMAKFASKMRRRLIRMGVLSEGDVARMKDIEFLSELVVSVIRGSVLDKKRALDQAMSPNGVDMRSFSNAVRRVTWSINYIRKLLPDIAETRFRKLADFYTLVLAFDKMAQDGLALSQNSAINEARAYLGDFAGMVDSVYEAIRTFNQKAKPEPQALAYVQAVRASPDAAKNRRDRESIIRELLDGVFVEKDTRRLFNSLQRRIIWNQTRDHRCCICRHKLKWPYFEIDHVKPHSKGGRTTISNGKLICGKCNRDKSNR